MTTPRSARNFLVTSLVAWLRRRLLVDMETLHVGAERAILERFDEEEPDLVSARPSLVH